MKDASAPDDRPDWGLTLRDSTKAGHPLSSWPIARILKERYSHIRFRAPFVANPFLGETTLAAILESPISVVGFLDACKALPHCGETQIRNLRHILLELQAEVTAAQEPGGAPAARDRSREERPDSTDAGVGSPLSVDGTFFPNFLAAWDHAYRRLWRLAHFDSFVYLPSSVPEISKTPAVLRAELGLPAPPEGYLHEMGQLRKSLRAVNRSTGLIMIDTRALDALFSRLGCYRHLSPQDIEDQLQSMTSMLRALPKGVDVRVTDFGVARVSPCAVVGGILNCSVLGGYFVTSNADLRDEALRRIAEGAQRSRPLADYLKPFLQQS